MQGCNESGRNASAGGFLDFYGTIVQRRRQGGESVPPAGDRRLRVAGGCDAKGGKRVRANFAADRATPAGGASVALIENETRTLPETSYPDRS